MILIKEFEWPTDRMSGPCCDSNKTPLHAHMLPQRFAAPRCSLYDDVDFKGL